MLLDFRVGELAPECRQRGERALLVRSDQTRIPRDIGGDDRGETVGLTHVPLASRKAQPRKEELSVRGVSVRQIARDDESDDGTRRARIARASSSVRSRAA